MFLVTSIWTTVSAEGRSAVGAESLQIRRVVVGIDGLYRVGRWTSVAVTLEGGVTEPVQLDVWVPDPDGNMNKQPSETVTLDGNGPHTLTSVFRTGRMDGVIRLEVTAAGQVLASRTVNANVENAPDVVRVSPPHTLRTEVWGLLGPSNGFEVAAEMINERDASERDRTWRPVTPLVLHRPEDLPTVPNGLEALDVLTVTGSVEWDAATDTAIRRWVEQGGHLIVSAGSQEEWAGSPLAGWVPIRVIGQSRLRDISALLTKLIRPDAFRTQTFEALQFEYDFGQTLASTYDGPLWVRMPFGMGRITVLGMDLGKRPFVGWDTLPQLCELLTDYQRPPTRNRRDSGVGQLKQTGVTDLATQVASAVDQHPEIEKPSAGTTMGLVVLYLILIGPLDYLIVHYVLRRPQWTWITFPLLVIGCALLANASARQIHGAGNAARTVQVLDLDTHSGLARETVWSSFVSPQTARHSVATEFTSPVSAAREAAEETFSSLPERLSWIGIPETGFRGMYRTGGLDLAKPRYQFAPASASIVNIPINLWSSSSVSAARYSQHKTPSQLIDSELLGGGGQLIGTITNNLAVPIEDWFIAYENLVYFPKRGEGSEEDLSFRAGATISLSRDRRMTPRVLKNYLTGVTQISTKSEDKPGEDVTVISESYDPTGTDFYRIFRAITFYRACSGADFTSLTNDLYERLDLSPLLELDRAVLYGRVAIPSARLIVDGEEVATNDNQTILRVLLPVKPRE